MKATQSPVFRKCIKIQVALEFWVVFFTNFTPPKKLLFNGDYKVNKEDASGA